VVKEMPFWKVSFIRQTSEVFTFGSLDGADRLSRNWPYTALCILLVGDVNRAWFINVIFNQKKTIENEEYAYHT
jgi:hypothetical protein